MKSSVQKWGNSLAMRIPANYAKDVGLTEGSSVEMIVEENRIVIFPDKKNSKLEEKLIKINDGNLHEESETGDAVGKEIW
ncbi:MAG: multidrug transporter MatE [Spirochaetes bacterium GWF1_51_8]|nr:MAG: multidrug transporter MatE [Spirochaetes bacterium GWF1_51_8]